jgi:transposase
MTDFKKDDLKKCSKSQLIEIILNIQNGYQVEIKPPQKNSENSSIPSSKDIQKKETKKRSDTEQPKRHGGPSKGHKGKSRTINEQPDIVIFKKLEKCPETGSPINSKSVSYQRHQIIELFPALIKVIEIQRQTTTGPNGKTVTAPNPDGIKDHQRFGPHLKAYIATLRFRFHMEWDNIRTLFELFYSESISKGAMNSIFNELKAEFMDEYQEIGEKLKKEPIVGGDETGARIDGQKYWAWVFRTDKLTQYKVADNRSHFVVEETLGSDYSGTIVSDFFGAYNDRFFPNSEKQKCMAHLSRDVKFCKEINDNETDFPSRLLDILYSSLNLKKEETFESKQFISQRADLELRLDDLLDDIEICKNDIEKRIRKRVVKFRKDIFRFLYNKNAPPDNNGSERDIRKWVIFRKIYGCFRSKEGAENLAVIMSIIETCKKQGDNIFDKIKNAYKVNDFRKSCGIN